MKRFIITVDTEGDNLWAWKPGDIITTENAKYIDRFQNLCEQYRFVPVYLCNYEMIMDSSFCAYLARKASDNKCEIGMHLHAWNSPPIYELENVYGGQAYITEFSRQQMLEKHIFLRDLIKEKTGFMPVSYRSGRWATNDTLFSVLEEIGIKVDCSVTPGVTMEHCPGQTVKGGNSYIGFSCTPYRLTGDLVEVPMTTKLIKSFAGKTIKNKVGNFIRGKQFWLRPAVHDYKEMMFLVSKMEKAHIPYLEFMIHSSELMPGGSPYGRDQDSVEKIYSRMEQLFETTSKTYRGISLKDYYSEIVDTL